jgi:hypothetical protein
VPSVILTAGLLVLLGLGLFVAGVLTGVTALYWGCVAVCVLAALLLFVARRRLSAAAPGAAPASGGAASPVHPPAAEPVEREEESAASHVRAEPAVPPADRPDPGVEDVEVTDLLLVVDLKDEVLVVDERPRYHLEGCAHLAGRSTIPLPVDEARTDGFTPCAVCEPDRNLAERARARKAGRGS